MPDPLTRLKRAARAKRRAEERYRAALEAASKEHGYAELARAVGLARQTVREQLTKPDCRSSSESA